jgi:uncharacterized protein with GYD domain
VKGEEMPTYVSLISFTDQGVRNVKGIIAKVP